MSPPVTRRLVLPAGVAWHTPAVDAIARVPLPVNEPNKTYAPGTPERAELERTLAEFYTAEPVEITGVFGDQRRPGTGDDRLNVTMPSEHRHVLGVVTQASHADAEAAIAGALRVAPEWASLPFSERAAVFLRAADLLAGPYRAAINAATMLGQGKTVQQAEIDSLKGLLMKSMKRTAELENVILWHLHECKSSISAIAEFKKRANVGKR